MARQRLADSITACRQSRLPSSSHSAVRNAAAWRSKRRRSSALTTDPVCPGRSAQRLTITSGVAASTANVRQVETGEAGSDASSTVRYSAIHSSGVTVWRT